MRNSLPRILSRWLRQGAEGDSGESAVGGMGPSVGVALGRPPALQRTRRAQPQPYHPEYQKNKVSGLGMRLFFNVSDLGIELILKCRRIRNDVEMGKSMAL